MGQVVQVDHIIVSWIYEPSLDCTTDDGRRTTDDGRRTTDDDDDDDDEEYGYSE